MVTTRSKNKTTATETVASKSTSPITTSPRQNSALWKPRTPPTTPHKRKRTSSPPDNPIPFKIRKTEPARQNASRPPGLAWLSELEKEELEPTVSQTSAGSEAGSESENTEEEKEPRPKIFHQDGFAESWEDIGKYKCLEYFQAYPHNEFSTLCVDHFMQLAETWYDRRKPMVNTQLRSMIQAGVTSKPDFSHMALPICEEQWTIKNLSDFKTELRKGIHDAKIRIKKNQLQNSRYKPNRNICELGNQDKPLKCALCSNYDRHHVKGKFPQTHCRSDTPPQDPNFFGIEEELANCFKKPYCGHEVAVTILRGGEAKDYMGCEDCSNAQYLASTSPLYRPKKHAIEVGGVRFPVEIVPAHLALDTKLGHVDVGGIHIIVDNCAGEPLIKFRSTRFSEAHEMYRLDFHEEGDVNIVKEVKFATPEEDDHDEEFPEQRSVICEREELYWRKGAFNAISQCSDQFDDCSCH